VGPSGANWLANNISHGRLLDYFYWVVN
jgi:hypothetical protein